MNFEDGKRDFSSDTSYYTPMNAPPYRDTTKAPSFKVILDDRVVNVENNIYTLDQQIS